MCCGLTGTKNSTARETYYFKFGFIKFILFFVFLQIIITAQTSIMRFDHFTSENGLPQTSIYAILQDRNGFLWLGTNDGLDRYDGYSFKVFRNNSDDTTSISANRVHALCEDDSGNLWVGTYGGGLNKYDWKTERFTNYKNIPGNPYSLSSNEVISIYEDKNNNLWIGTDGGGLNKFIKGTEKFIRYKNDPNNSNSLSNDRVQAIFEDRKGSLWIGTKMGGLNLFDRKTEKFIHYRNKTDDPGSISSDEIFAVYEDKDGNLWIGTGNGGLNKFNYKKETFTRFKHSPQIAGSISVNRIYSILEEGSGNLWIGTMGGGLNKYDPNQNQFIPYITNPSIPVSINSNRIFTLFKDNSNVLWIGTYDAGLNKLDKRKEQFRIFKNFPDNPKSLSNNVVFTFCEDQFGNIWIGTNNGLNRLNPINNEIKVYTHNPDNPYSLANNAIISVYEDRSGELWIGTYGGGLDLFDRHKEQFIHFKNDPGNPNSLSDNRIFCIYEDSYGSFWVGTQEGGLNQFIREEKKFIRYIHNSEVPSSLSANRVYTIYEDRQKNLWVGTDRGGLNKFDRGSKNFINYKHNPKDHSSLSNDGVFSIYESKRGELWIGTYGGGLNKLNRSGEGFESFGLQEGLPNEVIYGILEDNSGNLWLSTGKGISKFNPKKLSFKNYDATDGLQGDEFNQGAYLKSKSGEMFFGGPNGFNKFHPDSIKDNPNIPEIIITDFQLLQQQVPIGYDTLSSRTILEKSITETDQINLNYDDDVISFEFTALDFWNPRKNKYAYFMEGFDKDWTYTDASRRFVTYTNLDPGGYIFRVKGSNNDGIWNEAGTSVKLVISPPWWATWWAYTSYGLLFLFSLFAIRAYDMKRQRLKHQLKLEHEHSKKLEEIDQMKSRFFTNISHEFRTPLTLILGPAEKIISYTKEPETEKQVSLMKRNANRLLSLINQLLDISKLDEGKLDLKVSRGNLISFVKGIAMIFESLAETNDITLKVKSEKAELDVYFDKEKMERILINILSNAFKFTPAAGKITIFVFEEDNMAVIKIRDTGIGIPSGELPKLFDRFYQVDSSYTRERGGTGIGLALTKDLVDLHHGRINVDSIEGKGTEFTIELLMGRKHFKDNEVSDEEVLIEKDLGAAKYLYMTEQINADLLNLTSPGSALENGGDEKNEDEEKIIILIVEDNNDVRDYIKDSLTDIYKIEEASNGEQGVRKAEMIIPDLIISDIMMPKMDGYELTNILKNNEKTSHIPIILLTAKSEQKSKLEGLETGADEYLIKPFDTKELQVRVRNLINIRKKLQEKLSKGEKIQHRGEEKKLNYLDERFMNKVMEVIEKHISQEEFSIEEFGKEIGMSRTQLHRKLKSLTGKSASRFLRSIRLSRAKKMIENQRGNISEIAYSVGFSSPVYFSKCFKEEYGYPPSDLIN